MTKTGAIVVEAASASSADGASRPHPIPTSRPRRGAEHGTSSAKDLLTYEQIELTDPTRPASSTRVDAVVDETTNAAPRWLPHIQFFSLCWAFFMAGWNDGTTGTLLPRIQSNYQVALRN